MHYAEFQAMKMQFKNPLILLGPVSSPFVKRVSALVGIFCINRLTVTGINSIIELPVKEHSIDWTNY